MEFKCVRYCFFAFFGCLVCNLLSAQEPPVDSVPGDIFAAEGVLKLTLTANFDSLLSDAASSRIVARTGFLRFRSPAGKLVSQSVKIETRGNFRMKPQNCSFPPIRVTFRESDSLRQLFRQNKTLKLVSQCQVLNPDFEQYLLEEYLLYKIYARLTAYCFRVRLLKFTYINEGNRADTVTRYSFAVETAQELAHRFKYRRIVSNNVLLSSVDPWQYKLMCFFEYMISNNDWSVVINHNTELIQKDSLASFIPVPYDFDWAGIIHVPYKVPGSYGMETIRPERSFKGDYRRRREVKGMISYFNNRQGEIYAIVSGCQQLDDAHKLSMLSGIGEFYHILNNYFLFRNGILKKKVIEEAPDASNNSFQQLNTP